MVIVLKMEFMGWILYKCLCHQMGITIKDSINDCSATEITLNWKMNYTIGK